MNAKVPLGAVLTPIPAITNNAPPRQKHLPVPLSVSALHDTATSMNGTSSAALEAQGATALITQPV